MADDYASLVQQAYQSELGRTEPVEQAGLDYWTGLLSSGQITPDQLGALFSATPEGTAFDQRASTPTTGLGGVTGGAPATTTAPDYLSIVKQAYGTELGRTGDIEQAGLDYWSNLLSTGQITPDQLGQLFSKTPEGLKYDIQSLQNKTPSGYVAGDLSRYLDAINKGYQAEVYRPGELAGLTYWADQLMQGKLKESDLAKTIAATPEARVQDAYQSVFGRQADPAGLQYWFGKLSNGQITYDQVIQAMKQSQEYKDAQKKPPVNPLVPTTPGTVVTPPGGVAGTGFGRQFTPAEMELYYTYGQRPEHRFYAPSAPATTTTEENT
jgi:Domain of unknown function (DUF4214)